MRDEAIRTMSAKPIPNAGRYLSPGKHSKESKKSMRKEKMFGGGDGMEMVVYGLFIRAANSQ